MGMLRIIHYFVKILRYTDRFLKEDLEKDKVDKNRGENLIQNII